MAPMLFHKVFRIFSLRFIHLIWLCVFLLGKALVKKKKHKQMYALLKGWSQAYSICTVFKGKSDHIKQRKLWFY